MRVALKILVWVFLAREVIVNSSIMPLSIGSPCFSLSSKYFSAQFNAACLFIRSASIHVGTIYPLERLNLLQVSAMAKFALRAAATSTRVVYTDGVVFVEAAGVGDASCKMCFGVAFTFSQAAVKSPALARVGGSEVALHCDILDASNSFHCDIVSNGSGFPLSFPSLLSCCSSNCF